MGHTSFRHNNVKFLQEHNKEATRALDALEEERDEQQAKVAKWEAKRIEIQNEYGKLQQQLADTEDKCNISAAEIHKRDEAIRVLTEQNRSLLDMLEQEEKTSKEREVKVKELSDIRDKLQKISDQ